MSLIRIAAKNRDRALRSKREDAQSGLHHAISELSSRSTSATAESLVRAKQLKELCSIAYVIKAILYRVNEGHLTQEKLDEMVQPRIKASIEGGTVEAFEYIRDTLIDVRSTVTSLYIEVTALNKKVGKIEAELVQASVRPGSDEVCAPPTTLKIEELSEFLDELNLCTSEE